MYTIKSIIPFDLLIDTDMGVIKYFQAVFGDKKKLFYPQLMNMIGPEHTKFLQYALIHRKFSNPLSVIIKEEQMIVCKPDDLLDTAMKNNLSSICKLSTSTAIMDMVCKSFFIYEVVQFDILCRDPIEKMELLTRFRKRYKTDKVPANILIDSIENVDVDKYGTIYLKDIRDISKYKHPIEGKNIIIARYSFNQEYSDEEQNYLELPLLDVINEYTKSNEIKFIDVYSDIDNNGEG